MQALEEVTAQNRKGISSCYIGSVLFQASAFKDILAPLESICYLGPHAWYIKENEIKQGILMMLRISIFFVSYHYSPVQNIITLRDLQKVFSYVEH